MSLADEMRARRGDPDDPFDQEAARKEYRRSAGRRDAAEVRAHAPEEEAGAADSKTRQDAADKRVAARRAAPGRAASSAPSFVSDGSGFLLGLIVYALVLNYIRGGPAAVRGWLAAKFLNRPYSGPSLAPVAPASPAPPDAFKATGPPDILRYGGLQ